MKSERRNGDESRTREAILDATEAIMREEGYAAVTSRRVAEKAGLKSQLVHYYFGTMDDLFVAVYERVQRDFLRRHLQALTSSNPIRALWELSIQPQRAALSRELIAVANHKKSIQKLMAHTVEQMNSLNVPFISQYIEEAGLDPKEYPPIVLSFIMTGISQSLVTLGYMGASSGHSEVLAFVDRWLTRLETKRRLKPTPRARKVRG